MYTLKPHGRKVPYTVESVKAALLEHPEMTLKELSALLKFSSVSSFHNYLMRTALYKLYVNKVGTKKSYQEAHARVKAAQALGHTTKRAIAKHLGVHKNTVANYFKKFQEFGLEG